MVRNECRGQRRLRGVSKAARLAAEDLLEYNGLCNQDGFCGYYDLRALTIDDGVSDNNDPGPAFNVDTEPILVSDSVMAGAADLSAIGEAEMDAGRSLVRATAGGDVAASCCTVPTSASVEAQALSVMRVTDLVFSGPNADVETIMHLVFDGSLSRSALGTENAGALSRAGAGVGGAICNGMEFMSFTGTRVESLQDPSGPVGPEFIVNTNFAALEDVPLDDQTELIVGPFTVPTGVSLNFELWIENNVNVNTGGGDAAGVFDFALQAGAPGTGLVFELPPGFRADSPQAGIVDSVAAPEPSGSLLVLSGALLVAGFRASRVG